MKLIYIDKNIIGTVTKYCHLFFSQEGQELPAMTFRIDYNQSVHVKPTEELIIKDEIIRKEGA